MDILDSTPPDNRCFTTTLGWVLFVISSFVVCMAWWLVELPLLFGSKNDEPENLGHFVDDSAEFEEGHSDSWGSRFSRFSTAAAWNGARILSPTYVAAIAISRSPDPKQWPTLYYFGSRAVEYDVAEWPNPWQWIKILAMDGVPLVVQCVTAYRGATLTTKYPYEESGLTVMWVLSSVPAAITGFFLLTTALRPPPRRPLLSYLLNILVLALVGTALILSLVLPSRSALGTLSFFPAIIIIDWLLFMLPFQLMYCCGGFFHIAFFLIQSIARAAPILAESVTMSSRACGLSHPAFIAVYTILAWLLMFMAGCNGGAHSERYREGLHRILQINEGVASEDNDEENILPASERAASKSE